MKLFSLQRTSKTKNRENCFSRTVFKKFFENFLFSVSRVGNGQEEENVLSSRLSEFIAVFEEKMSQIDTENDKTKFFQFSKFLFFVKFSTGFVDWIILKGQGKPWLPSSLL